MLSHYDAIVIGLGAHGSAALFELSRLSRNVCGIDQYAPPHDKGSSHGQSRIIRQAYFEHPMYVPLIKRAYRKWEELEVISGENLFLKTGGVMLGDRDCKLIRGSRMSAETHGIPYDNLSHEALTGRFPAFKASVDTVGVLEREAGILFPEKCIRSCLQQARINGAHIRTAELVTHIEPVASKVAVVTDKHRYTADKVIICAGAWLPRLLPELRLPLKIERQVLFWFKDREPSARYFSPELFPIFIWEYEAGKMFYGFPDIGEGIKIAFHHAGRSVEPDKLKNDVTREEVCEMEEIARSYLHITPELNYATTCMYTNTPDEHFIIDYHPEYENIIVASPCSGHGFKFASYIGDVLASMAFGNSVDVDMRPFGIGRGWAMGNGQ